MGRTTAPVLGLALACVLCCAAGAQEPAALLVDASAALPAGKQAAPLPGSSAAPLAVRGDARPSFQMTPLVQQFSARPGQRLNFSFEIQTLSKPQSLQVSAVGLKQQLNGLVVVDEAIPPPAALQLAGPLQLDLKADQTATIRGYVDVPRSPAPFHAYGILVTDLGRPLDAGQPAGAQPTEIAVRFVTRFLLRVEVEVKGARPEDAKGLRLESAGLVDQDGQPFVEVDLANPSETGVEFQLHCRLLHPDGAPALPAFGLALPVRSSRPVPLRYESIVFGKSRVRLVGPVPEALLPGDYKIELEWFSHGRKCGKSTASVAVQEGDFPAQAAKFAQIAQAVRITPPQIELSQARGGTRRFPLSIANHSSRPLNIRLVAQNRDGTAADWVVVQPNELLLPAKRERNVLVTAQGVQNIAMHHYGVLRVDVSSGGTAAGTRDLPLALLGASADQPRLVTGPLRWDTAGDRPAFVLPVENQGPVHLPLNGRLSFVDASGRKVELSGGFDRWLLPGGRDEIRFPLHYRLPLGMFPVKVQIETGQSEPRTISQQVNVQ